MQSFKTLRDFNAEMDGYLAVLDDGFRIEETNLWLENVPKPKETVSTKVAATDATVDNLTLNARKAQFDADCLSLARDAAQLGQLMKAVSSSEQAARTEKVMHLRHQNSIGAGIVAEHMASHVAVHSGNIKDQVALIDRARGLDQTCFPNKAMSLFCEELRLSCH